MIPNEFLASSGGKAQLGDIIRDICLQPNVFAAGIIFEAYGAKMDKDDNNTKLVFDGTLKVSELNDRDDIIILMFSTPEGEELISYVVDVENKIVGKRFTPDNDCNGIGGNFSNFFKWGMN